MIKEIGGYFELEIEQGFDNISDSIALNCARNALRYVIQSYNIKEIYIPYYTCPVVWEAVEKENCKINYYHIDKNFMPETEFPNSAYILYTNYFGICARNVKELARKYKNLIIDNAQSFYMPKYGIASFNSIRKFFGVPDGSLLYCDKKLNRNLERDFSYERCSHLLKRIDGNASFGYKDFKENSSHFNNSDIKIMSNLTKAILNSIDINAAKEKRLKNFNYLHKYLANKNELNICLDDDIPMVYPYLVKDEKLRSKLIESKIYVAQYWSNMPEQYRESYIQKYLLPLPIDQRYSINDLEKIMEVICK